MGLRSFIKKVARVAPIVIAIAFPEIALAIGESLGASGAAAQAVGTGAIQAGSALAQGATPEQAVKSGLTAGAGSYAAATAAEALGPASARPDNIDVGGGFNPATGAGDPTTAAAASAFPSNTQRATAGGAAQGGTTAALTGQDPLKGALKGGLVGGGSQFLTESAGYDTSTPEGRAFRGLTSYTLSNLLGGGMTPTGAGQAPIAQPTSVNVTGTGAAPGSSALAQALRTDLGAPIFGGDKDKEGRKSGWNVESLRYTGGTGEA